MKSIYKYFKLILMYKGTTIDVIHLLWRLIVRTLSSFSFKSLNINANISMDKPEHLGYTIGVIEAIKQLLKNKKVLIKINPEFKHENYIYGELDFSIHFHFYKFLKNMLLLLYEAMWKRNLRNTLIKFFKKLIIKK